MRVPLITDVHTVWIHGGGHTPISGYSYSSYMRRYVEDWPQMRPLGVQTDSCHFCSPGKKVTAGKRKGGKRSEKEGRVIC